MKSLKAFGGLHPCTGKQKPRRSPSSRRYEVFSRPLSNMLTSFSPVAWAIVVAAQRVLPVPDM